ncbi:hypothetical protein SASPL_122454 [Salvia splendens]|uniref:Uncharacterized protein n=1 Tax=Salvia splendens TaxID=180675 RepID=A0A8X8ZR76_SALSN|nr:hypothetical protein SASPL_122454 [Salvia splendens]
MCGGMRGGGAFAGVGGGGWVRHKRKSDESSQGKLELFLIIAEKFVGALDRRLIGRHDEEGRYGHADQRRGFRICHRQESGHGFSDDPQYAHRWFFGNGARKGKFSGDKHHYSGEDLPVFSLVSSLRLSSGSDVESRYSLCLADASGKETEFHIEPELTLELMMAANYLNT